MRYITGQRRFPTTVETLYKKYLHLLANPENFTITCYYPRLQEALWVEGINIESGRTPRYKLKQGDLGKNTDGDTKAARHFYGNDPVLAPFAEK